jgi:hypothetical protein
MNATGDSSSIAPENPLPPWGPFTPGQMIRRTFELCRDHFATLLILCALLSLIFLCTGIPRAVFDFFSQVHRAHDPRHHGLAGLYLLALFPISLLEIFLWGALGGMVFLCMEAWRKEQAVSAPAILSALTRHAARIFWASVLIFLRVMGSMLAIVIGFTIVFGVPFALVAGMFRASGGQHPSSHFHDAVWLGMSPTSLITLLVVALVGNWLNCRYLLSIPVILNENAGALQSIRRSVELTRDSRSRIYALTAIYVGCSLPVSYLSFHITYLVRSAQGSHLVWLLAARALLNSVGNVVPYLCILGIGTALCYYDLLFREEQLPPSTPDGIVPSALDVS